jgi:hypothetical protein
MLTPTGIVKRTAWSRQLSARTASPDGSLLPACLRLLAVATTLFTLITASY